MAIRANTRPRQAEGIGRSAYETFAADHADFIGQIAALRSDFGSRLSDLASAPRGRQHHLVRQLLRMRHLHPLFAFDAIKGAGQLSQSNPSSIRDLAGQFDPFNALPDERVLIRNVGRAGGRPRLVCDFNPIRRMHQQPVSSILRHLHPPLQNQFLFNGGMPRALSALEAAVSAGATHSCELDFVDFYRSVSLTDLAEVMRPLPASVTEHVIWDTRLRERDLMVFSSSVVSTPTPETLNGLPLGSATSPIVGEVLIARLLEAAQLPGIITYADNLCVFGCSEEEVQARKDHLQRVLSNPPFDCVSGLSLHEGEIRNIVDPSRPSRHNFEFAHHESVTGCSDDGSPLIEGWKPSPSRLAQFQIAAADYVNVEQINRATTRVSNWRRYYARWPDGDFHEAEYLASLYTRRYCLAQTAEHRASAVTAVTNAFLMFSDRADVEGGIREFLPGMTVHQDAENEIMNAVRERVLIIRSAEQRRRVS